MQDYLEKPVTTSEILSILDKWQSRTARPIIEKEKAGENEIINYNVIRELKAFAGSIPEYHAIFLSFISDAQDIIKNIDKDVEKRDFESVKKQVHNLKGLSGAVGASSLFKLSSTINDLLSASKFEASIKLLPAIKTEYKKFHDAIHEVILSQHQKNNQNEGKIKDFCN